MKDMFSVSRALKASLIVIIGAWCAMSGNRVLAMSATATSDADYRTPELVALAAGLKNDRELIFQWVKKNIKYVQYYGCKKGAYLTYLERSGNDADQSALLVALWRAAGIPCQYVWGWIQMPVSDPSNFDWYHYLGADGMQIANPSNGYTSIDQLIALRGEPTYGWGGSSTSRTMLRVWAEADVNGSLIGYDPSLKLIQPVVGVDLISLSGYNRTNLLGSLGAGTSGTNSVTNLSYSGLSSYLAGCASQFVANYRNSYFNKTVDEILGGWKPLSNSAVDNNSFPIGAAGAGYGFTIGTKNDSLDGLSATYQGQPISPGYTTIQIQAFLASDTGHSQPLFTWGWVNMASLRGSCLGLVFENNKATLKLDDVQLTQASSLTSSGLVLDIVVSIKNPGVSSMDANEKVMKIKAGGTYALVYGFDVSSESVAARQIQLTDYKEKGLTDADSKMQLENLNVMGLQWMQESGAAYNLLGNLKGLSTSFLYRFGVAAQEIASGSNTAVYVDLPINFPVAVSRLPDPNATNTIGAAFVWAFISSAMEHGVLEQQQGITGVSTTKIFKIANDQQMPIYLADSNNWGTVQNQLSGYGSLNDSSSTLSDVNREIQAGAGVLLPKNGQITSTGWVWNSNAYASFLSFFLNPTKFNFQAKMIIGHSYSGGWSTVYASSNSNYTLRQTNATPRLYYSTSPTLPQSYGLDPVNLATGNFTHERELLTASDGIVRGLNFSVSYDGGSRLKNDAKIGYGWTHSYYVRATSMADVDGAFGRKTPVEMAASVVGAVAAMDVFANRTTVKDWLATALIANWMVDELKDSAVSIVSRDKIWQFHRQPDGTYTPPAGATQTLAKVSNLYQLTERNGPTWKFDASNRLSEIQDLWGKKLTLTYNASGDLATVTDAYSRTLTFTYAGPSGTLSAVADNSTPSRTVNFGLTSALDLNLIGDPEGKVDGLDYTSGHLLTYYWNHDGNIVVKNTYDATGRVTIQDTMGDTNKRWRLYYAPGQTIEEEPAVNGSTALTTHLFDGRNREVEVDNALGHRMLKTYDAQDRLTKEERIVGSTVDEITQYTYDGNHNLLTTTDPKSKTITNTYDGSNHLTATQDKRGNWQYFQFYNAEHQPTQTTDREGRVVTYTYKPATDPGAGSLATVTEAGNVTSYGYDARGALSTITYPGGATESLSNNLLGDPTTKTDAMSRVTTIAYNNRREVTSTTSPGTATSGTRTTTTTYDNKRDVATVTNPRGFTTSTAYSVTHKLLTTTLPDGSTITNHYDARDHVDWTKNPLNQTTLLGVDLLGRTTAATDPLGRTTSTIFDDANRKTTTQSPAPFNYQTKVTADERGQVIKDENGLGNYVVPGYDNNGNKTTWVDRRGKTWQFSYDKEDRMLTTKSPLLRTTTQAMNARGLLGSITEPSGQVTSFGYDNRRRLTSKTDDVGTVSYGLNAAGELTTVTQGTTTLTRTYHGSGQVATYQNGNGETISYDYDKNGNLVSLTYPAIGSVPAATVTYTYDNRDRLTSVTDWAGRTTTYTWDAAGKLTKVTRPNGTKRTLRWDAAGQMLAVEERPASGAPFTIRSFGYDSVGRITKRLSYPQATTWTETALNAGVDDDNRLTGGVLSYDADGNTLASLLPNGPWGGGVTMGEDVNFGWNARNQLTHVERGNGYEIDYIYDAEGNLVRTESSWSGTTRWIVDPNGGERSRVLAKVAPDGSVTRYVYGVGLVHEVRPDGSVRYYHYDQVGSTIALTDSTGAVTGRADYSPYGALQSTSGELATQGKTPFLFVGAFGVMTDATTGLHQMRARWYSSYTRRFLNEDPTGFAGGENFYAYASGNPISYADPDGKFAQLIVGAVIGAGIDLGAQLISNGGKISQVSWASVGVSAAVGATGVGLGEVVAKGVAQVGLSGARAVAANVALNAAGSAGIGAAGQVAMNKINGNSWNNGLTNAALTSAAFGGAGSLAGETFVGVNNAVSKAIANRAFNNASLSQKLLSISNTIEISRPRNSSFGVATGNVVGTTISNSSPLFQIKSNNNIGNGGFK